MREVTFEVPYDIPHSQRMRVLFKQYLQTMAEPIGIFGVGGRSVGIGYEWYTMTGAANGGLHACCIMARRLQRSLFATGIISRQADVYNLRQKITYIRNGDPKVVINLQED